MLSRDSAVEVLLAELRRLPSDSASEASESSGGGESWSFSRELAASSGRRTDKQRLLVGDEVGEVSWIDPCSERKATYVSLISSNIELLKLTCSCVDMMGSGDGQQI